MPSPMVREHPNRWRNWRATALGGLLAAGLAGCEAAPPALSVDGAWVRLPAVAGRPGAAYFTIHGGATATDLISVSADTAIQTEMHESMAAGMRPLARVPIPAEADVAFAPGGRHAMLFDLNRGIVPGRTVLLTFTFADGTRLTRKAPAVAASTPGPR